jgi:multidrug efflux pump subunit AcrA (membrane-fusion protein)
MGVAAPEEQGRLQVQVSKADLPIEVDLPGVFVADNKDEIRIEPQAYRGELIITKLVPEGRSVAEGEVLIEFDPSRLEDALDDANNEVSAKQVELDKADADLKAWEIDQERKLARVQIELGKAQRALGMAQEQAAFDLEEKTKEVKDAEHRLHDAEVDFQQLTQLYEERELHTETESILIERQQRQLENSRRSARKAAEKFDLWKKYECNNDIEDKQLEVDDKGAEIKKNEIEAAAERKEKKSEVAKAKRALQKAEKKVKELKEDTQSLNVLSPRDGIVFFGTLEGQDSPVGEVMVFGLGNTADEMKIGGRVRTHQVLLTVASMDKLSVKMRALESDIQHLKKGLPIQVRPDAFPALSIAGELVKVDHVASRTGFFSDVREFSVLGSYEGLYPQLRSGMNCRVTVRADSIPDCLQVPVLAVFSEGGQHYCLVGSSASNSKRKVEIGATNGTMVQVKEGLREGETIQLYDPSNAP